MSTDALDSEDLSRLEGRELANRYRLTRLVDCGGFGAVYEATDLKFPGDSVAVKLGMAVSSERAFSREALLIRQLNHENVVKVHDYGVEQGLPYIVMDMLHGERLDVLLEQHNGRLPKQLLIKFVREIGAALQNLHAKELVHRDLKPKNIMLVDTGSVDEYGHPQLRFVLLDFGIASKIDAANSLANRTMDGAGTPEYMSPEQVASKETTHQTDIYAIGVILYQLLTGRVPFALADQSHGAVAMVITSVAQSPPPPFAEVAPDIVVDPQIEALVLKCLEKNPEDRPASIAEVRHQFLEIYDPKYDADGVPDATIMPGTIVRRGETRGQTGQTWTTGTTTMTPGTVASMMGIVALVCVGVGIVAAFFLIPWPDKATFEIIVPESMTIGAGDTKSFNVTVPNMPEEPVQLALVNAPDGLEIQIPESMNQAAEECTVSADLNANPGEKQLTLLAKAGDLESEKQIIVTLEPPDVWVPDSSVAHEGAIVRIGSRNYYERLVYDLPGERPVVFLLIDPRKVTRQHTPFYIMQDKVWSGIYDKFSKETPDLSNEYFESPKMGEELLPAFGMTVNDAFQFATWLGGKYVRPPTAEEWWIAAGYFDRERGPEYAEGPYNSIGMGKDGEYFDDPYPVGSQPKEVSPHGCRDMAVNGEEWTCSTDPEQVRVKFGVEGRTLLLLVGSAIADRRTYEDGKPYFTAMPYGRVALQARDATEECGFRLVIDPGTVP